jgi:hypothetical protein
MHLNALLLQVFIPFAVEGTRCPRAMEGTIQLNVQVRAGKYRSTSSTDVYNTRVDLEGV